MPDVPDGNTGTDKPTSVHYPLFSTTEVHSDYVDWYMFLISQWLALADLYSVKFFGDLILSRSAKPEKAQSVQDKSNHILLWKIDGFSSASPV